MCLYELDISPGKRTDCETHQREISAASVAHSLLSSSVLNSLKQVYCTPVRGGTCNSTQCTSYLDSTCGAVKGLGKRLCKHTM